MLQSIQNAFSVPELRRRILYTIGILVIFRLLVNIPVPGVDAVALSSYADAVSGNPLIDTFDLLSGGAVSRLSIMALGVSPYITASIIFQLLTPVVPYLEELSSEGQSGQNKISKLTYYLTVPLSIFQAIAMVFIAGQLYGSIEGIIPSWGFDSFSSIISSLGIIAALTTGGMFSVWLGERITENGIGQGVSMIIFAGIVSQIVPGLLRLLAGQAADGSEIGTVTQILALVVFIILLLISCYVIVLIQEGQRRVPVQYGRRVRGRKVYQGQTSFIPMAVNTAGMIPIIFASVLLQFPSLIAGILITDENTQFYSRIGTWIRDNLANPAAVTYYIAMFLLVFIFTFFYTDIMVRQRKMHENLQRQGGFIPGVRPGRQTELFLQGISRRITFIGAFFLATIAAIPGVMILLGRVFNMPGLEQSAFIVNGSGLIIVVGVIVQIMRQVESQLVMKNYEGFVS